MRIGELARRSEVSVRSLRYYEEQGLLTSGRSASGQRTYDESAVDRVLFIRRLYAGGLSSKTIAEVLPCVEAPSTENSDEAWKRMLLERERLDVHIKDLLRTRDVLDELIEVNRRHRESLTML
jgi:DNA-binding transcriptional MerR regulator